MLENTTIARPYAQAAFEYASDAGEAGKWSDMLALLAYIVSDPDMQQLLHNPKVSDEQMEEIVLGIGGKQFPDSGKNFIRILIESGRLRYAPDIARMFEARQAQAENRLNVEVVTAYELNDSQMQAISTAMGKRYGKKIGISSRVDESLIGGAIIRAGDSVIDASIRGRLTGLRNDLV